MMSVFGAIILVVGFIALLKVFSLVELSIDVIGLSRQSLADIRNPEMDDEAKEKALQGHTKKLLLLFFKLTSGGIAALLVPLALVWLLEQLDVLSLSEVMSTVLSWEFILASTILAIVVLRVKRKR